MADVEGRCDRAAVRILAAWMEDLLVWTKVQIGTHYTLQFQNSGFKLYFFPFWIPLKSKQGFCFGWEALRNISQCV